MHAIKTDIILFSDIKSKSIGFCLNFIAAHHYNIRGCKVAENIEIVSKSIGFIGDTDTLRLTIVLYCIMRPYTEGRLDRYHI